MDEIAEGPTFRANKRRKVFRKRAGSDANDDEPNIATSSRPDQAPSADSASVMKDEEEASSRPDIARVRKPKKHGIAFSSLDRSSSRPQNDNEETAVVISEPQIAEQQNGRFTKQTGKTIVEDDKHMSAYIDSKLAELRYGSSTPNNTTTRSPSHTATGQALASAKARLSPSRDSAPLSPPNKPTNQTQQQTNPSKPPPPSRRKNRNPRQPSPSTTARATLIDQILRESNHTPHYTPSTASSNSKGGTNNTTLDPDAAAAEAFKADFLAQAEARNLSRRQPAANASAGAAGAASSGPKLGGSRAARERMRAVEEAKGKK
ncbi:hypothetical protein MBLNU13_g08440t1 [Cladosporium sp. NU13]